jgi:hypothetical protein
MRFRSPDPVTSVLSLHLDVYGEHDLLIIQRSERKPKLIGILEGGGHATSLRAGGRWWAE